MSPKMKYKSDEERKTHNLHIRLNDEELRMLDAISEKRGITRSACVLDMIRHTYEMIK